MSLNQASGNMYGDVVTWNPCGGQCSHFCDYCYVHKGRMKNLNKYQGDPFLVVKELNTNLYKCKNLKSPFTVFVCYDKETEILTHNGWKFIKDINNIDEVATLNKNGFLEYQTPTKIIQQKYNGQMYRLNTKLLDLFTTKDHNLFVAFNESKVKRYKFNLVPAKEVIGRKTYYKRNIDWLGIDKKIFILQGIDSRMKDGWHLKKIKGQQKTIEIPIEIWLKFLGFYLSEGSATLNKKRGGYQIKISTNNKDKWQQEMIDNVQDICKYLNRKCSISKNGEIFFCDKRLGLYLKQFGHCCDKFIPREYFELKRELLKILLYALIKGDGYRLQSKTESYGYATVSKQLADGVQELALKSGFVSIVSKTKSRSTYWKEQHRFIRSKEIFRVSICNNCKTPMIWQKFRKSKIEELIQYKEDVFCVEVPNHVIYVRRNGKGVWCGNCSCNDLFAKQVPTDMIEKIIWKCNQFPENTYLFQSKNPWRFVDFYLQFPKRTILATTLESNRDYQQLSKAPSIDERVRAMKILRSFKEFKIMLSLEPILDFDVEPFFIIIREINPDFVSIGADSKYSDVHEPSKEKVELLVSWLQAKTKVKVKKNLDRLLK